MWKIKQYKTAHAMNEWLVKNDSRIQWQEIFINNAYGVQYRLLRVM